MDIPWMIWMSHGYPMNIPCPEVTRRARGRGEDEKFRVAGSSREGNCAVAVFAVAMGIRMEILSEFLQGGAPPGYKLVYNPH